MQIICLYLSIEISITSEVTDDVCRTPVKVLPDGVVMDSSCCGHKDVPDGVGKGDHSITLEEHHTQAIDQTSPGHLLQPLRVALPGNKDRSGAGCKGGEVYLQTNYKVLFSPKQRELAVTAQKVLGGTDGQVRNAVYLYYTL